MLKRLRKALRRWWACRTKRCDYYQHYLAYGPPTLTHAGFHAAEKKCEEAQKRFIAWLDEHPDVTVPIPEYLERNASFWEKQVRA